MKFKNLKEFFDIILTCPFCKEKDNKPQIIIDIIGLYTNCEINNSEFIINFVIENGTSCFCKNYHLKMELNKNKFVTNHSGFESHIGFDFYYNCKNCNKGKVHYEIENFEFRKLKFDNPVIELIKYQFSDYEVTYTDELTTITGDDYFLELEGTVNFDFTDTKKLIEKFHIMKSYQ
jgi:hypothetical protein